MCMCTGGWLTGRARTPLLQMCRCQLLAQFVTATHVKVEAAHYGCRTTYVFVAATVLHTHGLKRSCGKARPLPIRTPQKFADLACQNTGDHQMVAHCALRSSDLGGLSYQRLDNSSSLRMHRYQVGRGRLRCPATEASHRSIWHKMHQVLKILKLHVA